MLSTFYSCLKTVLDDTLFGTNVQQLVQYVVLIPQVKFQRKFQRLNVSTLAILCCVLCKLVGKIDCLSTANLRK